MPTYNVTLKDENGNDFAPRTIANNVIMTDGRTAEVVINKHENDISGINTSLGNKADILYKPDGWKTENDLPSAYPNKTPIMFRANTTFGGLASSVQVYTLVTTSGGVGIQAIFRSSGEPTKFRLAVGGLSTWGEWQTIVTSQQMEQKADKTIKFLSTNYRNSYIKLATYTFNNALDCSCKYIANIYSTSLLGTRENINLDIGIRIFNGIDQGSIACIYNPKNNDYTSSVKIYKYNNRYDIYLKTHYYGDVFGIDVRYYEKYVSDTFTIGDYSITSVEPTGTLIYDSSVNPIEIATTETGTWTPEIVTGNATVTYTTQTGNFVKIGKLVRCTFDITYTLNYTQSGGIYIVGLPILSKKIGCGTGIISYSSTHQLLSKLGNIVNKDSFALIDNNNMLIQTSSLGTTGIQVNLKGSLEYEVA